MDTSGKKVQIHDAVKEVLEWWRKVNQERSSWVALKTGNPLDDVFRAVFQQTLNAHPSHPPRELSQKNPYYALTIPCAFAISIERLKGGRGEQVLIVVAQSTRKVDTALVTLERNPPTGLKLTAALGMRYETEEPANTKDRKHKFAHAQLTPSIKFLGVDSDPIMHGASCGCDQPNDKGCTLRWLDSFDSTPAIPVQLLDGPVQYDSGEMRVFKQLFAAALLAALGCDCEAPGDGTHSCSCCGGVPGAESAS